MNSINLVDPNIGKKQLSIKTSVNHEVDDGNKGFLSSTVDTVTLASKVGARKIVSSYETVQFSKLVPKQLPAKKLETADILSKKINNGELLSFKEESSIREDRVLAAIVGMRFMQNNVNNIDKRWVGGLNPPTDAELDAAYRRLTQRVSSPEEVDDPDYIHNMRVELLDTYRGYTESKKNIEMEQSSLERNAA